MEFGVEIPRRSGIVVELETIIFPVFFDSHIKIVRLLMTSLGRFHDVIGLPMTVGFKVPSLVELFPERYGEAG